MTSSSLMENCVPGILISQPSCTPLQYTTTTLYNNVNNLLEQKKNILDLENISEYLKKYKLNNILKLKQ